MSREIKSLESTETVRMTEDNNHCPELWERLYLHQVNRGFVAKPCCYAKPYDGYKIWITDGRNIFDSYNQSPEIEHLRSENLQGRLGAGCEVCQHAEQTTGVSGRTQALIRTGGQRASKLTAHVDLNLGNLCNLACAICDPHSSTAWAPVYQKMQGRAWTMTHYDKHDRAVIDDPGLFEHVETLQLQGGEVFMQSAYTDFFQNLAKVKSLSRISVIIFTNGTMIPSAPLWRLLQQCRSVDLYFSIDDIQERFEYQRHGAKWSVVLENLRWFELNRSHNIQLGFHPTYSLLNIYYLGELQKFLSNEFPSFQRRWGPYHVNTGPCIADTLPPDLRQAVIDRCRGIDELDFLKEYIRATPRDFSDFLVYIDQYDQATRASYRHAHSEFYQLLGA